MRPNAARVDALVKRKTDRIAHIRYLLVARSLSAEHLRLRR